MSHEKKVTLRNATVKDRRMVYEWLVQSDCTPALFGWPLYSDSPALSWDEFCDDYKLYFFDGTFPRKGRCYIIMVEGMPVGQVNHDIIDPVERRTQLDIWMSSESQCGKGYGPEALQILCERLHKTMRVSEFILRPSERNTRAVRAFEKAGFHRVDMSSDEQERLYGPGDCSDSIVMIKGKYGDE